MSAPRPGAVALLALALAAQAARAQTGGPSPDPEHGPRAAMTRADSEARAARRFPQPVRAGDLVGRALLEPVEAQPVLGRVAGLVHRDGATELAVRLDGWLGLGRFGADWPGYGARLVAVPVEAVALMGEFVALIDLTPERLRALPTLAPGAPAVPPDETIRVGIVRPFH